MSVIFDMKRPKSCDVCDLVEEIRGQNYCKWTGECVEDYIYCRDRDCPIKAELPEHHGRLIDADALIQSLEVDPVECPGCPEPEYLGELKELLKGAPTIIEATRKEKRK